MGLFQLISILKAHARFILGIAALTMLAAVLALLIIPKSYKATTSVVLNYKGTDPLTGTTVPGQSAQGYLPTYISTQIDLMKSKTVALRVVDELKLTERADFREEFDDVMDGRGDLREWIAETLLKELDVNPSRESSVINITYKTDDPKMAADVANAFAEGYQLVSVQLDAAPSKSASEYFGQQLKSVRENFEKAQAAVSTFQQEHGIVNADSRIDVEHDRLREMEKQLVAVEVAYADAVSRSSEARGARAEEAPDVASSPVIQNLKLELSKAQAKLNIVGERYMQEHPTYREAKAEVDKLQAALQSQVAIASRSLSNSARVLDQRRQKLAAAIGEQRAKLMALNYKRDELALKIRDMETARHTYETVSQRLAQARIQGGSDQSDVSILHPATPPMRAAGPSRTVSALLAGFVGLFLGVCAAIVRELMDRRVRSGRDLEQLLGLPLLGSLDVVAPSLPAPQPRLSYRRQDRALLGA